MYQELISTLNQLAPIEPEEEKIFISIFKPKTYKHGEYFIQPGSINRYLGFITKGLVRYYIYRKGTETTIKFGAEGEFVAEYRSFMEGDKSAIFIQMLEDTQMLVADNIGIQTTYKEVKNGNAIGRLVAEQRFTSLSQQLLSLYQHSPEERYTYFMQTFPELIQRVPQYYIASFVGVKPESLSRIKKRILSKKIS